jgi:hypothetical protein
LFDIVTFPLVKELELILEFIIPALAEEYTLVEVTV